MNRPLLVFDGDCGFCRFWVERWRHRTDGAVDYEPFQSPEIARRYPQIPVENFEAAVHLFEPDGSVSSGAEAVFRLAAIGGRRTPLSLYEHVPGLAPISEMAYGLIARHRPTADAVRQFLWGNVPAPSTYARAAWLFQRGLGIIYLIAFASFGVQAVGLIGHNGILPVDRFLTEVASALGPERFWQLPTLAWISSSDTALSEMCIAGVTISALLVAGVLPRLCLAALWLLYLSLSVAAGDFLSFQWDALLLETGFLAIFLAPWTRIDRITALADPPRLTVWLLRWLLCRLMIASGAAKLASGDPAWHNLTALAYHFETQPIPTPVAWYVHQLPLAFMRGLTAATLIVEMVIPLLVLAPRRLRAAAFVPLAGLQLLIAVTGNYAFFNLLTIALCLFLLDDAMLGRWGTLVRDARVSRRRPLLIAVAAITLPVTIYAFTASLGWRSPAIQAIRPLAQSIAPFRAVNAYGLFSVMTTTRPEIIVEGSDDGENWLAYEFKYKAGDPNRRPPWVAPHQPRLDWQMWFAALGRPEDEPWFREFCIRLLTAEPSVLNLLAKDPFNGRPPQFIRARLYHYRFADRNAGGWWTRVLIGEYMAPLSFRETFASTAVTDRLIASRVK